MARAKTAPTYPGDGIGVAELSHTGVDGESLVFDGPAHNLTTGRQMVWRCKISNWDGRVGGMTFSTLEGMPHNLVHNCIGGVGPLDPGPYGNMTNFLSPVDPIFHGGGSTAATRSAGLAHLTSLRPNPEFYLMGRLPR